MSITFRWPPKAFLMWDTNKSIQTGLWIRYLKHDNKFALYRYYKLLNITRIDVYYDVSNRIILHMLK